MSPNSETTWIKSSRSMSNGACVEVAELDRLRTRALEANGAELLRRTEKAEAMTAVSREQIESIQAERDAMPEGERIRREAADAPLLRIQLAHFAGEGKRLRAELAEARETIKLHEACAPATNKLAKQQRERAERAEGVAAEYAQKAIENGQRAEKAEAERDALRSAIEGVLSDPIMHSPLGEPLVRVEDVRDALSAPESNADASTAVTAATEAHGGAGGAEDA